MTDGNNQDNAGNGERKRPDEQDEAKKRLPVVAIRPRPLGSKTWPRLLRLRMKDGTPIEELMMR